MLNKRPRQRGLHHPRLSPQGLYQLLRHCSNPRTRIHEDFYLSSRGHTGNRKTPCDMLRQRLQMRFGVHRIQADPPGCETETREYEMVLESPSHCCDAGAGSCTGTD